MRKRVVVVVCLVNFTNEGKGDDNAVHVQNVGCNRSIVKSLTISATVRPAGNG